MSDRFRTLFPVTTATGRWLRRGGGFVFSRRILKPTAILITLVAVVWQFENWRARRAWAAMEERLSPRGESLDWRDSVPKPIADADNAARHPIFTPALIGRLPDHPGDMAAPSSNPNQPMPHGGFGYAYDFSKLLPPLKTKIAESPLFTADAPWPDLTAAQKFLRAEAGMQWPGAPVSAADDVLWATRGLDPLIAGLEDAFRRPGYDFFPLRVELCASPAGVPIGRIDHFYSFATEWARLLSLRIQAHLAKQDSVAATRETMTGLNMSRLLTRRNLVATLVELASRGVYATVLQDLLGRTGWSDSDLQRLSDALRQTALIDGVHEAMRLERLGGCSMILWAKDHSAQALPAPITFKPRERQFWKNSFIAVGANVAPAAIFYQNAVTLATFYQTCIEPRYDPVARRLRTDVPDPATTLQSTPINPYTLMAHIAMPAISNLYETAAATQTRLDQCRLLCALHRHRSHKGGLPASLTELVPEFIERVPHDYMTGRPIDYQRDEAGGAHLTSETWPDIAARLQPAAR